MKIQRGDILFANLGRYQGSVQGGNRPVVVISNNKVNRYSTVITVVPLSTKVEKRRTCLPMFLCRLPVWEDQSMTVSLSVNRSFPLM